MTEVAPSHVYMGVDVGIKLHVVIRRRQDEDRTRALFIGEVDTFEELGELMGHYDVRYCVIDAQPELHKAREFARSRPGRVWLAYYDREHGDHEWVRGKGADVPTVHVNRTQAHDEMFERFRREEAELPADARRLGGTVDQGIGEYYREMMAPKRILEQNSQGNWVSRYDAGRNADHYAHAEVYGMLAGQAGPHTGATLLRPFKV